MKESIYLNEDVKKIWLIIQVHEFHISFSSYIYERTIIL